MSFPHRLGTEPQQPAAGGRQQQQTTTQARRRRLQGRLMHKSGVCFRCVADGEGLLQETWGARMNSLCVLGQASAAYEGGCYAGGKVKRLLKDVGERSVWG